MMNTNTEHLNTWPTSLSQIHQLDILNSTSSGKFSCQEYESSRLKATSNRAFRAALYPMVSPANPRAISIELRTEKPNYSDGLVFAGSSLDRIIVSRLKNEHQSSHIDILIINTEGSENQDAMYSYFAAQYGKYINRAFNLAMLTSSGHRATIAVRKTNNQDPYQRFLSIVILTNQCNHGLLYKLAALLPAMMDDATRAIWLPDNPPLEMYAAMGADQDDKFWALFSEWYINLMNARLKAHRYDGFDSFFKTLGKDEEKALTSEVDAYQRDIKDKEIRLAALYESLRLSQAKLFGVQYEHNNENLEEILAYIRKRKGFIGSEIIEGDSGRKTLLLDFFAPCNNYERDYVERLINRGNWPREYASLEPLVKRIFIEQTHTLWFHQWFVLDPRSTNDNITRAGNLPSRLWAMEPKGIPNPHIYEYGCWGNSRFAIINAAKKGDWIVMIEQCIAAITNFNFTDGPVFRTLFSHLSTGDNDKYNRPCIQDNAHPERWYTVQEFVNFLKSGVISVEETETIEPEPVPVPVEEPEDMPAPAQRRRPRRAPVTAQQEAPPVPTTEAEAFVLAEEDD
jgi:hypothetical protein